MAMQYSHVPLGAFGYKVNHGCGEEVKIGHLPDYLPSRGIVCIVLCACVCVFVTSLCRRAFMGLTAQH